MPGPVLFVLNSGQHLRKIAIYVLNNLLTLMSDDDHNMARLRIQNRGQHVTEEWPTQNRVQNLGQVRLHPRPGASGQNNN